MLIDTGKLSPQLHTHTHVLATGAWINRLRTCLACMRLCHWHTSDCMHTRAHASTQTHTHNRTHTCAYIHTCVMLSHEVAPRRENVHPPLRIPQRQESGRALGCRCMR